MVVVVPAAFTVSAKVIVVALPELSFTIAVTVLVPAAVGVPESKPLLDNVNPAGQVPELRE